MRFWSLSILIILSIQLNAQVTITGVVYDSISKSPVPYAKIKSNITGVVGVANENGYFKLESIQPIDTLTIRSLGYFETQVVEHFNSQHTLTVYLKSQDKNLNTIVINPGENPAFKILRLVDENRDKNNPDKLEAFECEIYTKMRFDIDNMSDQIEERAVFKKMDFVFDYTDTLNGEKYLPVMLTESISDFYFKSNPQQKKEVLKATRVTGVNNLQMDRFTGEMYQQVNIYENDIVVFNKEFISPIAPTGKIFYKYYLMKDDTISNRIYHHIIFKQKRKGDLVFNGEMWIDKQTYAVKKIIAEVPDDVNLNYVSGLKVQQEYELIDSLHWMLVADDLHANFDVFEEWENSPLIGVAVHKHSSRKKYRLNQPKSFDFYVQDIEIKDSAKVQTEEYWKNQRHESLSEKEKGVIEMTDSLQNNKRYKFYENLLYLSYTGFWRSGPMEYGNIFSLYNRNVIEGHRVMVSLRTSNKFSKKIELNAFGIYGTLDQEFKYGGSIRYKFKDLPREMFRIAYRKRIDQLGLSSSLGDIGNSFSTLFSAGPLDKLTMVNLGSISFEKDWNFDMRTFNAVEWKKFIPLGSSDYRRVNSEGDTINVGSVTSFEIRNQIMYTKDEKFLAGQFDRISLGSIYPIISLTHTWGIKGVLGSEYDFHRLDFVFDHRPRIGFWGRLQYSIYAGKVFGQVPYPFLNVHQGNETYYLQLNTPNLMNYYEFISDEWVGVNFEHHLQGLIMDRVPLIRKLKWRLVYNAKAVVGRYNPKHNTELILPYYSHSFSSPYYETGIGMENIFKFIRVDALWRLSYRNHVNLYGEPIPNFGVKFTFTADF